MVIVTQNQYILASKIHHITLDEQKNILEYRDGSKYKSHVDRYFQLTIMYTPEATTQASNNGLSSSREPDMRECTVYMRGTFNAQKVFQNLIQQIREQMPDQLYLDKALEQLMSNSNSELFEGKDEEKEQEELYDRSAKKIRLPRKTKRTNQGVLRKSKKRR